MRADDVVRRATENAIAGHLPCSLSLGGVEVGARLACGFLACDAKPFNPLLGLLPPMMKVGDTSGTDASWLGQILRYAKEEAVAQRPGGEAVRTRLSELMFIEIVRRHIESLPADQTGWLAGLRDPFVGRALALIHGAPAQDWTLADLARDIGMSRSVLAERFAALVGMPPMRYLANWRMQIAAGLLARGANIATAAAETGYGSEAAFSRAFKNVVGTSPSAWRERAARPRPISR
jgi:AraC-like DNA-binding protein